MDMFACIPEALLASILMDWLSLKDFGRLDSAMCNRKCRDEMHQLVSSSLYAFEEPWDEQRQPTVDWMISRGVRCRINNVSKNLLSDHLLQQRFLNHIGATLHTIQIDLTQITHCIGTGGFREMLRGLSVCCTGLHHIDVVAKEKFLLGTEDFLALHGLLKLHPSLQCLTLRRIEQVPMAIVQTALVKLTSVSLQYCSIDDFGPTESQLNEYPRIVSFQCVHTQLPRAMCCYVTDITTNCLVSRTGAAVSYQIADYTNLTRACVLYLDTSFDTAMLPQLCMFWHKLEVLRLPWVVMSEAELLVLIKRLPLLRILDVKGNRKVHLPQSQDTLPTSGTGSLLHTLCTPCEQASTLLALLQLCPLLVTLSLTRPFWRHPTAAGYVSVEKSLHLICHTNIRHLYLLGYMTLCDNDVAVLQHTQFHTVCISDAGSELHDGTIVQLIPTLHCAED